MFANALKIICLTLLSATLLLSVFAQHGSAQQTSYSDLSGSWSATTYLGAYDERQFVENTIIEIRMNDEEVSVTNRHGSIWSASFDQQQKVLNVVYRRNGYDGTVILKLNEANDTLEGPWASDSGRSGWYIAVRKGLLTS